MKKLTAGIFATLLAVVSTGAANAKIASQAYVDEKDAERVAVQQETDNGILTTSATGAVQVSATIPQSSVAGLDTTLAGKVDDADLANYATKTALTDGLATKASQSDVAALTGRVTTAEGEIDALQAPTAQVAEGVTGPVSGGTVYDAIEGVTGNVGSVTGRVDTLEGEMDTAQSDITALEAEVDTKQDKLTGPVGSTTQPVYVNAEGNVVAGTAYGPLATKTQIANADVADNAAIAQSKIANLVTDLAAKITAPAKSETGETGTWVLTYDGTKFQWEDITRAGE